jgi:hypothetical protein
MPISGALKGTMMSTNSDIIVQRADGRFEHISCHFDGYLDGVGKTLMIHYTDQAKCNQLVALGAISSLAAECADPPEGHCFNNRIPGHTVAYHRDRGDPRISDVGEDLAETYHWNHGVYAYVFSTLEEVSKPQWWVSVDTGQDGEEFLIPLMTALKRAGL